MNLQKCSNGHYYDADAYASCPHCSSQPSDDNKTISLNALVEEEEKTVSLVDAPSDVIKTVRNGMGENGSIDDQKTISFFSESPVLADKDPVIGWLVCTKGQNYGMDYRLKTGRNFIGRGSDMDVCLRDESTVSRDRHAVLIYEPKQNLFLVQPGESRELTYLNDEVVLVPTVMKKNDVLQLGDVSLMLIPCCDDKYQWE